MILQGLVGPAVVSDGANAAIREGRTGEVIVQELHGKYYEQTFRGNTFTWTPAAIVMTTAGTTTQAVALVNPQGNSKNLSLIRAEVTVTALASTPIVGTYGLYVNTNPAAAAVSGTASSAQSNLIGSNYQPSAKVFTTATLPANPTLYRNIANKDTGAATTIPYMQSFFVDFDGTCVLTPGTAITLAQNAADGTNATAVITFIWEEN